MTPTKIYPTIPHVAAFGPADEHRNTPGPLVGKPHAFAILATSPLYPAARISIAHPDIGSLSLTSEQSAQLEDRLAQARGDVDAASDAEQPRIFTAPGPATPGRRCECCCEPIRPGEPVQVFREPERAVIVHAERCPTRCAQPVRRSIPDPAVRGGVVYEDAFCPRDAVATAEDGTRLCGICAGRRVGAGERVSYDNEVRRG